MPLKNGRIISLNHGKSCIVSQPAVKPDRGDAVRSVLPVENDKEGKFEWKRIIGVGWELNDEFPDAL